MTVWGAFAAAVLALALGVTPLGAAGFSDVPDDYWAAKHVDSCADAGIVRGFDDGSYQPTLPVTRDAMAAYIARGLAGGDAGVPTGPAEATFVDVPNSGYGPNGTDPYWAYKYIEYCVEHGIVHGYDPTHYQPLLVVDRGQMAVFIARTIARPTGEAGLAGYMPPATPAFLDVSPDGDAAWCYPHVEYVKQMRVAGGYDDGLYHPEYEVTRDQMAVFAARAFELLGGRRVLGYLPSYRLSTLSNIDLRAVTNLSYFNLDAYTSGSLKVGSEYLNGLPGVVQAAHDAGVKVSACVGGWLTDSYFAPIAHSDSARATFIGELVTFCLDHDLDGVDLDWEPVANADVPYYSTLIEELRAALAPHHLLLSVAASSGHHDILASTAPKLDWVGVMAYDMNWPHADHSTYDDAAAAMAYWTDYGIEKGKLLMGVPFYGRDEGWSTALTYAEIVDLYNPTPDQNWAEGFFFNGLDLVKRKADYAFSNGFGGMMIWELGQDKFDDRSLLAALVAQAEESRP